MRKGFSKVFGCLAASQVGSAMGAAVEGMSWSAIEADHGILDQFLPYEHYSNGWQRPGGTTEDGIERQRVFLRAIRRAGGVPSAWDVGNVWHEELDPAKAAMCMEPYDRKLIALAKAGIGGPELGWHNPHAGTVGLARSCHPVALACAGSPEAAARAVGDAGRAIQRAPAPAIDWAAVVAASIAAALMPGASVETVLRAARRVSATELRRDLDRALALAEKADNPLNMREAFDERYSGRGIPYAMSQACEVVPKGFAVFKATAGNVRAAIVTAVNFGRDTDCLASIAGGLAGALAGAETLPGEWVQQVDAATEANPYTNLKLPLEEQARIVWDCLATERDKAATRAHVLDDVLRG